MKRILTFHGSNDLHKDLRPGDKLVVLQNSENVLKLEYKPSKRKKL